MSTHVIAGILAHRSHLRSLEHNPAAHVHVHIHVHVYIDYVCMYVHM